MDSQHLFLLATLMQNGRFSIRDFNPKLKQWNELKENGLCIILEGGRAGTLVIHPTEKSISIVDQALAAMASN